MKTLLIGYRTGIGKAIYDTIPCDGVSKNELDIDTDFEFDFSKYDCIILNAYSKFTSQLKTLYKILENVGKDRLVIVIGSTSAYRCNTDIEKLKYTVEKHALIKSCRQLTRMDYKVSILNPDLTDTHYNKHKKCIKLDPKEVAEKVKFIIDNYKNGILIDNITIRRFK
jgi:hypothetical protein